MVTLRLRSSLPVQNKLLRDAKAAYADQLVAWIADIKSGIIFFCGILVLSVKAYLFANGLVPRTASCRERLEETWLDQRPRRPVPLNLPSARRPLEMSHA